MNAERPTFNQIQDQRTVGHSEPSVLVKRSNGTIGVGVVEGGRVGDRYIVKVPKGKEDVGYKPVAAKGLSDESQERLARELGGPLLGEEDVEQDQPEEDRIFAEYRELVVDLSEDDKVALWWYVAALYPAERDSAHRKMGYGLQQNHQLITKAQEVFGRLKKVREANRE